MKKIFKLFLGLILMFYIVGCGKNSESNNNEKNINNVIELNEHNYWKYIDVKQIIGSSGYTNYEIKGVLTYALYEDVIFAFDVIYYMSGQSEEEYNSYTILIGCNAGGNANFITYSSGITNVTIGKWLGVKNGELVSLENYNWKIHFNSVSGKVIYSVNNTNYDNLFGKN